MEGIEAHIVNLGLSRRTYNRLARSGITTISDLVSLSKDQILNIKGIGDFSYAEIERCLSSYSPSQIIPKQDISHPYLNKYQLLCDDVRPIIYLDFSPRINHALERAEIDTISKLIRITAQEIFPIKGIGKKSLDEIEKKLEDYLTNTINISNSKNSPNELLTSETRETVSIEESISTCLSILNDRNQQIIRWRHGLDGDAVTLADIGVVLGISRERVRQLESAAIRKLKNRRRDYYLKDLINYIVGIFESKGGIIRDFEFDYLFRMEEIFDIGNIRLIGVLKFLSILTKKFRYYKRQRYFLLDSIPVDNIIEIHARFTNILEKNLSPTQSNFLLDEIKKSKFYQNNSGVLSDETLFACLQAHPDFAKCEDGSYSLKKWENKIFDEIVLALRELGEPTHYSEITRKTNNLLSSDQKTSPRNVHAQLGRYNDIFVRVGHGIFGLAEWGIHDDGNIANAVVRILNEESQLLPLASITSKVLENWRVNPGSVHMAITNDDRIIEFESGQFGLIEWELERGKSQEDDLLSWFDEWLDD